MVSKKSIEILLIVNTIVCLFTSVGSQDVPHQAEAFEEAEAESSDSAVDPHEDGQHDPLQRQAPPLEEDQTQALSPFNKRREFESSVFYSANSALKYPGGGYIRIKSLSFG